MAKYPDFPETAVKSAVIGEVAEPLHQHHTFIRTISGLNYDSDAGVFPGAYVDAELTEYLNTGWTIHTITFVEKVPEGLTFAWFLVK